MVKKYNKFRADKIKTIKKTIYDYNKKQYVKELCFCFSLKYL